MRLPTAPTIWMYDMHMPNMDTLQDAPRSTVILTFHFPICPACNYDNLFQTNGSSIVSKRSVERLYYDEPHFFRYFVKKPQRRSPLINRGYWLRMHAVEVAIRRFLEESSQKQKVILNLGCG